MTFLSGLLHYALRLRGTFSPVGARLCIFFSILAYGLFISYAILEKTRIWQKIGGY